MTANSKFRSAAGVALGNTSFMPYDGYLGPDVNTMAYLERLLEDPPAVAWTILPRSSWKPCKAKGA